MEWATSAQATSDEPVLTLVSRLSVDLTGRSHTLLDGWSLGGLLSLELAEGLMGNPDVA